MKSLLWKSIATIFTKLEAVTESQHTLATTTETIMATLQELTDKLDGLQVALDAEQAQVAAALAALEAVVADLQAQLADGATPAQLQALIDRIGAIQTDLEGTIPDPPAA